MPEENSEPTKKYLVVEGYVLSKTDGQEHFISCERLVELYRVNRRECVFRRYPDSLPERVLVGQRQLIPLLPRYDGNYDLTTKIPTTTPKAPQTGK